MQVLRTLLNQQLGKGKISPTQFKDIMKQYQDSMDDAIRTNQREQEEEEEVGEYNSSNFSFLKLFLWFLSLG